MTHENDRTLYWPGVPEYLSDFVSFQKVIKGFKYKEALPILEFYYDHECKDINLARKVEIARFIPQKESSQSPQGRKNLGIYSTALCLSVVGSYRKELESSSLGGEWTGAEFESRIKFISFLIMGLSDELIPPGAGAPIQLGPMPRASILDKMYDYLDSWGAIENGLWKEDIGGTWRELFLKVLRNTLTLFANELFNRKETVHPFTLYKFLMFLEKWEQEIVASIFTLSQKERQKYLRNIADQKFRQLLRDLLGSTSPGAVSVFDYFFDDLYFLAKYELYRQMALKLSNDIVLYDAKRLAYSLLVVSHRNRFSNNLIREHALNTLFEPQRENASDLWPTGQLLPVSQDGLMAVAGIEVASDLLKSDVLFRELSNYLAELKSIYDFHARTMQVKDNQILGWYPPDQRDKTPQSYITGLVLSFFKEFCKLLASRVSEIAEEHFQLNWREPNVEWRNVYDCTAAKWKLRLISLAGLKTESRYSFKSAILFGPPGTGKTTLARAVASRLEKKYLELTPGDFFAGGEGSILQRINNIFENMLHLQEAVVFIDEIDDLVRSRESESKDSPFDPRELYVNTLLPRFQELRDKAEIILILGTNHFKKVDPAIARLGRVDLIIPVGALSPYGRLKLLASLDLIGRFGEKELVDYLSETQYASYSELKMILQGSRDLPAEKVILKIKKAFKETERKMKEFYQDIGNSEKISIRPPFAEGDIGDYQKLRGRDQTSVLEFFLWLLESRNKTPSQDDCKNMMQVVENLCGDDRFNLVSGILDDLESVGQKPSLSPESKRYIMEAVGRIDRMVHDRSFV